MQLCLTRWPKRSDFVISMVSIRVSIINSEMDDIKETTQWVVEASEEARRIVNPLRNIVDKLNMSPNPDKELLNLSIGMAYIVTTSTACIYMDRRDMAPGPSHYNDSE